MKKLTAILLTSALLLSITVSATTSGITFTHNIEPGSLAIGKWGTQVIIENPDELKLEVESIEANRSSIDSFFGDVADSLEIEQPPSVPMCACGKEERTYRTSLDGGYSSTSTLVVVLTHCVSISDNRDWTIKDFPGIGAMHMEQGIKASAKEWEAFQDGRGDETNRDWTRYRRSFLIFLDQSCQENFLNVVQQLHQREDVLWVGPSSDAHAGEDDGNLCGGCGFDRGINSENHCCGTCLWCGNCWWWCKDCGVCKNQDCWRDEYCEFCGFNIEYCILCLNHNCCVWDDFGPGFCGECDCCSYFERIVGCCKHCEILCWWGRGC